MPLVFEWDAPKAKVNQRKHGVSFDEACTVFDDPLAKIFPDEDHSDGEQREIIVGHSILDRLLLVSFAERARDRLRINQREEGDTERAKGRKHRRVNLAGGTPLKTYVTSTGSTTRRLGQTASQAACGQSRSLFCELQTLRRCLRMENRSTTLCGRL